MQHLYKKCCFLTLFIALMAIQGSFCSKAQAQTADTSSRAKSSKDTVKSHHLKEVSIRAARLSLRNASATPVQILKGADLEKLNSISVADAIRFFSGVQLKDYGGIGGLKTVNVRSLGTNHVAVFYDGVEFGNAQNGQVDLGKFSLDNIQEIELYNAQKSTIFQPAKGFAAGASLYLLAKQPSFEAGSRTNGKLSFKTGSFGLINPSLLWQYKLSDNLYSSISTEVIHANGRYRFRTTNGNTGYDTTAIRHNGDIDAQRIEAGLYGKLKDSSSWNIKGYRYHSNRGLPGPVVNNNFDSKQRQKESNVFVQSSYNKKIGESYNLMLSAKYSDDHTEYFDPTITTTRGLLENKYRERELYLSAANKFHINSFWDAAFSVDYQRNTLDATQNDSAMYRFVRPVRNTLLTVVATELHFKRFNVQASILRTFVKDEVDTLEAAGKKIKYTPTVLVSWQPFNNPDLRLRGFYKSIFRLPSFNDLYYTFIGFALLRPEYTKQYDVGFTYNKTFRQHTLIYLAVQADIYYNQVKDKIVAIPGLNLARWTMYNLGMVHISGAEINSQATWQLPGELFINTGISYTYQKAIDVTNTADPYYRQQIPYTPHNSGSVLVGAEWRRFAFNYSYMYVSSRYDSKENIGRNYLQPWYTHDVSFSYTANYNKHKIKLTGELNNVLSQDNTIVLNYPMPQINYRFTISSTF